jgi:hypothetical protein
MFGSFTDTKYMPQFGSSPATFILLPVMQNMSPAL